MRIHVFNVIRHAMEALFVSFLLPEESHGGKVMKMWALVCAVSTRLDSLLDLDLLPNFNDVQL